VWRILDFVSIMSNMLKRILVGVCIALVMMCVHKYSRAATYVWTVTKTPVFSASTPSAACAGWGGYPSDATSVHAVFGTSTEYYCNFTQGGREVSTSSALRTGDACGSSGSYDSSTGVCTYPPPADCQAGRKIKFTSKWGKTTSAAPPLPKSDGSCNLMGGADGPDAVKCYEKPTSSDPTQVYCDWEGTQSGTASPQSDAFSPPIDGPSLPVAPLFQGDPGGGCGGGMSNVGTDSTGSPICSATGTNPVVPDKTSVTSPTSTTTNSDGSTTTTGATTNGNADGSKTTDTTTCTTGTDGTKSCSTSRSTTPNTAGGVGKPDGAGVKADGKPDDPKNICQLHPELNVCSNSQVSGGDCSGAVSTTACTGDAIQCAMLRQMRDENCSNLQPSPLKDLGNNLLAGTDPMQAQIDANKKGDTVDLSSQALDSSGFLGGGSCFADRTISVAGRAVPVPFTGGCTAIQGLRYAVLACALVAAYLLVSKSVIQGA
jgi:hypothetical protein